MSFPRIAVSKGHRESLVVQKNYNISSEKFSSPAQQYLARRGGGVSSGSSRRMVQALVSRLRSTSNTQYKRMVLVALARLGRAAKPALPFITQMLNNSLEHWYVRLYAAVTIYDIDPSKRSQVVPVVIQLSKHSNNLARSHAGSALALIGGPLARRRLKQMLRDPKVKQGVEQMLQLMPAKWVHYTSAPSGLSMFWTFSRGGKDYWWFWQRAVVMPPCSSKTKLLPHCVLKQIRKQRGNRP